MTAETLVMKLQALRRPALRGLILSPDSPKVRLDDQFTKHTAAALRAYGSALRSVALRIDADSFDLGLLTVGGQNCLAAINVTEVHFNYTDDKVRM